MTRRSLWKVPVIIGWLLAIPSAAIAQSSIAGTVKDTSGAVLPGVTVTITSPVLIEGSKEVTTDGGGNYRVVDLRPGSYTVKFVLTGFASVERTGFQLLSDFNARIDADMKVGAMEETITVSGQAPIVDVQSATKVAVLDREALDNVPTGKTIPGLGQLVLGVTLSAPDVGGSAGAMNTYMSLRGGTVSSSNNTVMVDGMVINGLQGDGSVQTYTNDADFQEMSYQTAGMGAERSGGGVAVNLIPKEGGNRFSGSASALMRPGALQAQNYSERFKTWGLPVDKDGNPLINRIERITDLNIAEGGPIKKDKLWFFASARDFQPVNTVPNTFNDDGSQGLDDNFIRNTLLRLTFQASPQHKFAAYYERVFKWRGHDMGAYDDPETAARVWTSPHYSTSSAKYTGTISPKLLVEGGFSQNVEFYRTSLNGELQQTRGSDKWYANASRAGTGYGVTVAIPESALRYPVSQVWSASSSYVTGAHHAKVGFQLKHGPFHNGTDGNADLQ
ncbi:MAG TPA: TonB-dependent receptor, partial [Vicinamibacterales bacterium]|nr:TonB-dependent receptor [Vicinamibacterales bacterium]